MKSGILFALALAGVTSLRPAVAAPPLVLTPVEVASGSFLPPGSINYTYAVAPGVSVSPADESVAFGLTANYRPPGLPPCPPNQFCNLQSFNIWTVPRFGASGTQITTLVGGNSFHGIESDAAFLPQWNNAQFIAYRHFGKIAAGPLFRIAVTGQGFVTPDNLSVELLGGWGPDGRTLVFIAQSQAQFVANFGLGFIGPNAIYTVSYNGFGPTKIYDCAQPCTDAQWSSDDLIAYAQDGAIGLMGPDGSNRHPILDNAEDPVWSPATAGLLAFSCGDDVCVVAGDGAGPPVNLTNGFNGLIFSQATWSSDESLIAMVGSANIPGAAFPLPGDLYVASPAGLTLVRITTDAKASGPQFSPILPVTPGDPPNTSSPAPFELFYSCAHPPNVDICVLQGLGQPPGQCDSSTCQGCCLQSFCYPGNAGTACGLHRNACTICTGGQECNALGDCADPNFCGIGTCAGCCDLRNICHEPSVQWCGRNGDACLTCSEGEICDTTERVCKPQLCNASSCPRGCCDQNGLCSTPGTINSACGLDGRRCEVCSGSEQCSSNGSCEPAGCAITGCATGCCDPVTGQCKAGNVDTACGVGRTCLDCTDSGQVCDKNSKSCAPAPIGCPCPFGPGCCDGNECRGGNDHEACGIQGSECRVCGANESCQASAGFCF